MGTRRDDTGKVVVFVFFFEDSERMADGRKKRKINFDGCKLKRLHFAWMHFEGG